MDIEKSEWRLRPPLEPMTSLGAFVRDFVQRFPRERRDMVWDYCRTAPGLGEAITRACDSRTPDGKMHNHQSRVTQAARDEFATIILTQTRKIRSIARGFRSGVAKEVYLDKMEREDGSLTYDSRFDELHDLFDDIKPYGIGPVTVYDVATRVGAYLDIDPTSLYLHAGVRQGVQTLEWSMPSRVAPWSDVWKARRLTKEWLDKWWPEFDEVGLPPDEIEDMLCTYRHAFMLLDEGADSQ